MLAFEVGRFLFSLAGRAAGDIARSEIHRGWSAVRSEFAAESATPWRDGFESWKSEFGDALGSAKSSEGGAAIPFVLVGAAVAGIATVVFVPKVRNAVLDYHDGALRKFGIRTFEKVIETQNVIRQKFGKTTDEAPASRSARRARTQSTATAA